MAAAVTPVFPYRMLHLLNLKVQQQQLQKTIGRSGVTYSSTKKV